MPGSVNSSLQSQIDKKPDIDRASRQNNGPQIDPHLGRPRVRIDLSHLNPTRAGTASDARQGDSRQKPSGTSTSGGLQAARVDRWGTQLDRAAGTTMFTVHSHVTQLMPEVVDRQVQPNIPEGAVRQSVGNRTPLAARLTPPLDDAIDASRAHALVPLTQGDTMNRPSSCASIRDDAELRGTVTESTSRVAVSRPPSPTSVLPLVVARQLEATQRFFAEEGQTTRRVSQLLDELAEEKDKRKGLEAQLAEFRANICAVTDALDAKRLEVERVACHSRQLLTVRSTAMMEREVEALKAKEVWLMADKRLLEARLELADEIKVERDKEVLVKEQDWQKERAALQSLIKSTEGPQATKEAGGSPPSSDARWHSPSLLYSVQRGGGG